MKPSVEQIPVPTLPAAPPPPPPVPGKPQGVKPGAKSLTPSYLNSGMVASKSNIGQKQLVGQ
jgi:hypothetical protein